MSTKRTQRKGGGGGGGESECPSTQTKKPNKKRESDAETLRNGNTTMSMATPTTRKEGRNSTKNNESEMCSTQTKKAKNEFSDEAKIAAKQFTYQTIQNGLHQLRVQYSEIKSFVPADSARTHNDANQAKCRYKDVPCWDRTRVVLTFNLKQQPGNDFVHANRVTHELLDGQQFICCQGPLDATVPDFWRCVWQEKVKQIIMLCRCEEMGKNKCAQYWPQQPGAALSYHGLTIRCEKVDASDRSFIHTKLSLNFDNETRTIDHRQWTSWPDKSVPKTPLAPFRLLNYTRRNRANIVHCSAGVGRTGTLVIIEMMYKSILKGKVPDVVQLVKDVRSQRSQAVQTEDQYLYCHYALLQLLHIKKIVPSHFVKHYIREYEGYLKLLNDVGGKNLPMAATNPPVPCANCGKVAAQMYETKQAESPPSEAGKHESKKAKDSKRDGALATDRKPNKQSKKEEKEKRGKQQQQSEVTGIDQTTKEVADPNKTSDQVEEPKPSADAVSQHPNVTEKNVEPSVPQQPQSPPPPPAVTTSAEQPKQVQSPPPQQQQQTSAPPPAAPQQQQAAPASQPAAAPTPAPTQQPAAATAPAPQPAAASQPQPATPPPPPQSQTPVDGQPPAQQMQQQQSPPCDKPAAAAGPQKFKYTPAATYTVQQAGNKKAIVYQKHGNQPYIKALASPAGVPQQMCLVASNGQQQPQQPGTTQPPPVQQSGTPPAVQQ